MTEKVKFEVSAEDKYSKTLDDGNKKVEESTGAMGKGYIVAAAALAAFVVGTNKAVDAANEQEKAENSLTIALGRNADALFTQASALQSVTTFGDEATIQAQALIAAFVDGDEAIMSATEATLDLAAATGMDLVSAAGLVARSIGTSMNALSRYGIEVEGAVGSTERLNSLTGNIADRFGGQAQAATKIYAGAMTQLDNSVGDVWEGLGFFITKNEDFIKVINEATEVVGTFATTLAQSFRPPDEMDDLQAQLDLNLITIQQMDEALTGDVSALEGTFQLRRSLLVAEREEIFENIKALGQKDVAERTESIEDADDTRIAEQQAINDAEIALLDERSLVIAESINADNDLRLSLMREAEDTLIEFRRSIGLGELEELTLKEEQRLQILRDAGASETEILLEQQLFRQGLKEEEAEELTSRDELIAQSVQARANVANTANKALEKQMLSLVRTGKFSAKEFIKTVALQAQAELAAIATKATINAVYETALGLAALATGNPASSVHFASAGEFAVTAALAGGGAAVIGNVGGGGSGGGGGGSAPSGTPTTTALPTTVQEVDQRAVQNVNITINPSGITSPEVITEQIIDLLNENASSLNKQINVDVLEAN